MKERTEVRTLKKGKYVIIDDEVCIIANISTSKPGKHGSAKARIDAFGLFDRRRRSIVQPVSAKMDVPIVEKKMGQVLSISNDTIQIMDMENYSTFELKIPEEGIDKLEVGRGITFIQYEDRYKILI
jgi:translation initiation factor 5A